MRPCKRLITITKTKTKLHKRRRRRRKAGNTDKKESTYIIVIDKQFEKK